MADIFVSYASADRNRVLPIVRALEADGLSVWWDRNIPPGPSFDRAIEKAIDEAGCMLVVWSAAAVESEWVRSEVDEGARREILVPVQIDDTLPPLAHRRRQSADLRQPGTPLTEDANYQQLLAAVRATLDREPFQPAVAVVARARSMRAGWPIAGAALALGALIGAGITLALRTDVPAQQARPVSFDMRLPEGVKLPASSWSRITIDRNGERIYVIARHPAGFNAVYARRLSELAFTELDELRAERLDFEVESTQHSLTAVARGPQPGALVVGYGGKIATLTPGQTRPRLRATSSNAQYARMDWSPSDVLAVTDQGENRIILSYPDGTERSFGQTDDAGIVSMPAFSPDEQLLFVVRGGGPGSFHIEALEIATGSGRDVVDGTDPRTTSSGLLLFLREGRVHAARVDPNTGVVVSSPRVVLDGVEHNERRAQYAFSDDGTLVYQAALDHARELAWIDREGTVKRVVSLDQNVDNPRLSPDGNRVALTGPRHVFVAELRGGLFSRVAATTGIPIGAIWSPDGRHIAFGHWDTGAYVDLWRADAAGGDAQPLLTGRDGHMFASQWTPDGGSLLFSQCATFGGTCDVGRIDVQSPEQVRWLLRSEHDERYPVLTPDGNWLAYSSTEFGEDRVVIRRVAALEAQSWQVPGANCTLQRFNADASSLFSVCGTGLFETPVRWDDEPVFGTPQLAFAGDFSDFDWDISADGQRVVRLIDRTPDADRLIVVLNWLQGVEALFAGDVDPAD